MQHCCYGAALLNKKMARHAVQYCRSNAIPSFADDAAATGTPSRTYFIFSLQRTLKVIARARAEMGPRVPEKLVSKISQTNINCEILGFGIRN